MGDSRECSVILPDDMAQAVEERICSGAYASVSDMHEPEAVARALNAACRLMPATDLSVRVKRSKCARPGRRPM